MAKLAPTAPKRKSPLAGAAAPAGIEGVAQAELDPVIAALTNAVNQRAKASEAAINGYTQDYANQLGTIDAAAPYAPAIGEQASVDAALQQSLAGGGSDLASQLASRLAALGSSSGGGALAGAEGALSGQGSAAGTTRLASGSAALGNLIANQAAAGSFSKKLPSLAKLSGLQGLKQAEGNAQSEIASGTQQIEGELPTVTNEIRSARESARALASENAYRNAEIGLSARKDQIEAQQGQERINSENAYHQATIALRQQSTQQAWDRIGIEQRRLQMEAVKSEQSLRGGSYTPIERAHFTADAATIAQNAFHGFTDSKGTVHKPLSYQQAMNEMVQGAGHGTIPPSIAMKALNAAGYKVGIRGTPPKPMNALQKTLTAFAFNTGKITTPAARTIVGLAHEYMGTPYVWGGESPKGFDCSGFAQFLYAKAGIQIPRTTYTQWQTGHPIAQGQLRPGDLVFFKGSDSRGGLPGHVGIYIGGGKMIDAPHTGSDVRIDNVASFGGYMGARRYGNG